MNKHWRSTDFFAKNGLKMEEKRDIIIPRADKNSWITLPMRD